MVQALANELANEVAAPDRGVPALSKGNASGFFDARRCGDPDSYPII